MFKVQAHRPCRLVTEGVRVRGHSSGEVFVGLEVGKVTVDLTQLSDN